MRAGLRDEMARVGVTFRFERLPRRIERVGAVKRVTLTGGEIIDVDQVLVATGRRPDTKSLGLEAAGVRLNETGAVVVDARSTSNLPSIHAVGDVTDRINLTPVAIREGHWLADRLFGGATREVNYDAVATAVFTTPEIGTVGLTEAQARASYETVDIYKTSFRPLKATITGGAERTIMKLVVDGQTDRVLGAHILGAEAGETIQALAIAVKMGATKADLDDTMPVHPTAAEELVTMRERTARYQKG
jgi:glutathione reductase (NADPH)